MMPVRSARSRNPWLRLLLFGLGMAVFGASYYLGNRPLQPNAMPCLAVLMRPPLGLPDLRLIDAGGDWVAREHLLGHWTLLAFPERGEDSRRHLGYLGAIFNQLAATPELQALLLLAPVVPAPSAQATDHTQAPGPPWRLLRGPAAELDKLGQELGLKVTSTNADPPDAGKMLLVIDPQARLYALYPTEQSPERVARDLETLAHRYTTEEPQADAQSR